MEALNAKPVESAAARLATVGELAPLINATNDLHEIFRRAIVLVRRVLDFRRASVVLVDDRREHYVLHTLYDALRGGFITRELSFSLDQGLTGEVIRTGRPFGWKTWRAGKVSSLRRASGSRQCWCRCG